LQSQISRTVEDLRGAIPTLERTGIKLVFENHEDLQGKVIADILSQVNHPLVRALYDYGNSQMVGEEPLDALESMAPFVSTVHVKDHVVVVGPAARVHDEQPVAVGHPVRTRCPGRIPPTMARWRGQVHQLTPSWVSYLRVQSQPGRVVVYVMLRHSGCWGGW
jgi:sugar phosphate isomerase/epimerase